LTAWIETLATPYQSAAPIARGCPAAVVAVDADRAQHRASRFIGGVGRDAAELAGRILGTAPARAAAA
jgi:hypothetical protein